MTFKLNFIYLKPIIIILCYLMVSSQNSNVLGSYDERDSSQVLSGLNSPAAASQAIHPTQAGPSIDDLLVQVDPTPAQTAFQIIIDCITYLKGDTDTQADIRSDYTHVKGDIREHLLDEAWRVIEKGTLNEYLKGLREKTTGLQKLCIRNREKEIVLIQALSTALNVSLTFEVDLISIVSQSIVKLRDENIALKSENEILRKQPAARPSFFRSMGFAIAGGFVGGLAAAGAVALFLLNTNNSEKQ